RFQLVNVVEVMRPITKDSVSIVDPDTIPTVLRNAFALAQTERPGAVHLELPADVAVSQTNSPVQKKGFTRRPAPDARCITQAAELINKAHSPLIILSSGANRDPVCRQLTHFINRTGLYAIHTQMGKGVLSDESPYSLFATGIHRRDYVNCGIDRADLIITIGYNIVEYPPYVWNKDLNKKIINVDFAEAAVDKYYNPKIDIIGDISCSLRQLGEIITHRENNGTFKVVREFLNRKLAPDFNKQYPLTPQEVVC